MRQKLRGYYQGVSYYGLTYTALIAVEFSLYETLELYFARLAIKAKIKGELAEADTEGLTQTIHNFIV